MHFGRVTLHTGIPLSLGYSVAKLHPQISLKSEVDTWQKHRQRYIKLRAKQNEVRFHILHTSELREIEFSYALL